MADKIYEPMNNFYNKFSARAHESTYLHSFLEGSSKSTGFPIAYIASAITALVLLFFVWSYGPVLICDMIAVFAPVYLTFQALEKDDKNKIQLWLKYWIVFGVFHIGEKMGDAGLYWIYGYPIWKLLFLIFCFVPVEKNGGVILYENFIKHNFHYHTISCTEGIKRARDFANRPKPK